MLVPKYLYRLVSRRPSLVLLVVMILGLGIGACTAVFSLVNAILLKPLPFHESDHLFFVWESVENKTDQRPFSYPNFADLRRDTKVFESLSIFANPTYSLTIENQTERISGELVSGAYFHLLGVSPFQGRSFTPEEEISEAERVAMIGHDLWARLFGRRGDLIGEKIEVNGEQCRVIGILPEGFRGITGSAELWLPAGLHKLAIAELEPLDPLHHRDRRWHAVVGRLRSGTGLEGAAAELDTWSRGLAQAFPQANRGMAVKLVPMSEQLFGSLKAPLILLQAAVIFVLLIACINIANMLLARCLERQKEFAVRASLGAGQLKLVKLMMAETVTLGFLGGVTGIFLAALIVRLLNTALTGQLPVYIDPGMDVKVLGFAIIMSLLTGLVVGVLPAIRLSRPELTAQLKESSAQSIGGIKGRRSRNALVVAQMALAMILLVSSILLIQGFERLETLDLGFAAEDRIVARLDLSARLYSDAEIVVAARDLISTLESKPSVRKIGLGSDVPLDDRQTAASVVVEGFVPPDPEEDSVQVYQHVVSPGFFQSLGIPLLRGRYFHDLDDLDKQQVGIVSEHMARNIWPDDNPIGKRIRIKGQDPETPWISVVGVIGNVRYRDLFEEPSASFDLYLPFWQAPAVSFNVVAHTELAAETLVADLRQHLQGRYPGTPLYNISTMAEKVEGSTSTMRVVSVLMGLFGLIALVLAGLGIYAVISYSTHQRRQEIGIRIAMGARSKDIALLVVRGGILLSVSGLVVGGLLAFFAAKVLEGSFFGVTANAPGTWTGVLLLLLLTSLFASFAPAKSASRFDPMEILRD